MERAKEKLPTAERATDAPTTPEIVMIRMRMMRREGLR